MERCSRTHFWDLKTLSDGTLRMLCCNCGLTQIWKGKELLKEFEVDESVRRQKELERRKKKSDAWEFRITFAWRRKAHEAFDPLWQKEGLTRADSYVVLQKIMKLPEEEAHIAKMDIESCKRLIKILTELGSAAVVLSPRLPEETLDI